MLLDKLNEENFICYLAEQFAIGKPYVGIGDDTAVIPAEHGESLLVTTDALIEGVHFLKDQISPRDLGYKTVAVSVSDIVAMGGTPKQAFLTIALPKSIEIAWLCEMIEGIKEASVQWKLALLGGDTVGSKRDIFLNLTLLGTAKTEHIKYRTQAKPGDIICVTGYLGDSCAGLKALQQKLPKTEEIAHLILAHVHPQPQPEQGIWLSAHTQIHAIMDISDGLDCDLKKILKASQVGAVIETTQIPLSAELKDVCNINQWDPLECAITGGEDYCLLLTVTREEYKDLQKAFQNTFGQPLFNIGHVNAEPEHLLYLKEGLPIEINYKNFDHFE